MLFLLLAISLDTLSPPPSLLAPAQPPPIWMVPVNPLESPKRIGPGDSVWWQGRLYLPAKPAAPKKQGGIRRHIAPLGLAFVAYSAGNFLTYDILYRSP